MFFYKRGGITHPFYSLVFSFLLFSIIYLFLTSVGLAKKLDVNQATVEELEKLPGIGKKTAQAIVDYREKNGPFKSWEDLEKVKGLGPKKIQLLRSYLTLGEEGEKVKQDKKENTKAKGKNTFNSSSFKPLIYYYVDEKGKIHYTQFPESVPLKYRHSLRPVNP
ncbi:ComEA family DNA-binding protein [Thermodesulfobacterium sp. TA1]|uniref:ComEA family DNA-binding protein n=1 Tax=Thermodesulfobacterium sp. TA1 TaxID=2234087 RepID=UPI001231C071|nr:ComEA family DNA-binding protein [Thermodesulfobacterium sp. TA1]QER42336.1 ComEA family DNA-binding protein [Thermodesulfobacterium sp. TA1]